MWQVVAASTKGTGHERCGLPCQDVHGYLMLDHCIIAAVADGLGSASRADEGAQLAVDAALAELKSRLSIEIPSDQEDWERVLLDAFTLARLALEQTASFEEVLLREYATTLIVAVITEAWIAVAHLGDGAVVVALDDSSIELITAPSSSEFVNETAALSNPEALHQVRWAIRPIRVVAAALFTDGLQSLAINFVDHTPHVPFFMPFFEAIQQPLDTTQASSDLDQFLSSERVCARTDDDKTLLLIGQQHSLQDCTLTA